MPADLSATLARYATGRYQPASFLERGVALPFTTPQLLGGRIRPAQRSPTELVLANPAGAEGVYIVPWSAVPDIASPTLHDRALWARVAESACHAPRAIRAAARAVAAEGYAGRAAARAAVAADAADHAARIQLHYHLLLELVRQNEGADGPDPPPDRDHPARVEARAQAVLRRLRGDGPMTQAGAIATLEQIADACLPCGLRHNPTAAALPALMADIAAVTQALAAWGVTAAEGDRAGARLLIRAAEITLRCARGAMDAAQALLDPLWPLLQRWCIDPDPVRAVIAWPEWVLDGWGAICALWHDAPAALRDAALFDMAALVPVLPTELRGPAGFDADVELDAHLDGLRRWRRGSRPHQDWMRGRQLDLISRNEALRARAA